MDNILGTYLQAIDGKMVHFMTNIASHLYDDMLEGMALVVIKFHTYWEYYKKN